MHCVKVLMAGAASLVFATAKAVPDDARRAECEAKARELAAELTPEECVGLMSMDSPAVERLGIPRFHWWSESLHGYARSGLCTVFPQSIGMAATFDEDLEWRVADAISTEARAKRNLYAAKGRRGMYQCLSLWDPNINMLRDPRWGRAQETFGEDPFLTGTMGAQFVRGIQGDNPKWLKAIACIKHLAVHSGPEAKRHVFDVKCDKRDMCEYYLPAFKKIVCDAQVESVMGAYTRLNGTPCCANSLLMNGILRGEWGFKGLTVSDVGAVRDIYAHHKYVTNGVEACLAAMDAGLDLCSESAYRRHLTKGAKSGAIDKRRFETPLVRILTARALVGDFEKPGATPWDGLGAESVDSPAHRALALEAAEKSLVLVKNNGALPVDPETLGSVTLWGKANEAGVMLGNYSGFPSDCVTVAEGFVREIGVDVRLNDEPGGDVVVACLGMDTGVEDEECDRETLAIDEKQLEKLRKARKKAPDAKIVAVVFGGSSQDIREVCELCDAVLLAMYPGEQGGAAIARTILGRSNPAGRLPMSYFATLDGLPDYEDYSVEGRTYRYGAKPFLPFGYGLSYTTFAYGNLKVEGLKASVEVMNTGARDGDEVVQLYVRSPEGCGDRRLHHLEGFRRVHLKAGETMTVEFPLAKEQFAQYGMDGRQTLANGVYTIFAGGGQPGVTEGVLSASVEL